MANQEKGFGDFGSDDDMQVPQGLIDQGLDPEVLKKWRERAKHRESSDSQTSPYFWQVKRCFFDLLCLVAESQRGPNLFHAGEVIQGQIDQFDEWVEKEGNRLGVGNIAFNLEVLSQSPELWPKFCEAFGIRAGGKDLEVILLEADENPHLDRRINKGYLDLEFATTVPGVDLQVSHLLPSSREKAFLADTSMSLVFRRNTAVRKT